MIRSFNLEICVIDRLMIASFNTEIIHRGCWGGGGIKVVDVVQFVKPSKFKTAVSVCEGRGEGTRYYHVYKIPSKFNIEVTHSSICGWYVVCIGG